MSQSSASSNAGDSKFLVNFNQDFSSLSVCSKNGYRIFTLSGIDNLDEIYSSETINTLLLERLFSSSLVAVVTLDAPRTLLLRHFKKGSEICNYSYSNTILSCKLNRARLVVCLEESIYIHNIRDMRMLHTIRDTPPNPHGLIALTSTNENHYLAYPGSSTAGEVQIFDAANLHSKRMISAHESPLAALAFSPCGTRIATASEKGTVIRVFSVNDGATLYAFRRGVKRCVAISSLAFSTCSQYLGCSSNTETVHVFKLVEVNENVKKNAENSFMGYLSSFIPSQVNDLLLQGRAFYTALLPKSGLKNVIAITHIDHKLCLIAATEDGYLYVYNVEGIEGSSLNILKQHNLNVQFSNPSGDTAKSSNTGGGQDEADHVMATTGSTMLGSYAGILKGNPPGHMSGTDDESDSSENEGAEDSDKYREMAEATESPPKDGLPLNNDREYPPLFPKKD